MKLHQGISDFDENGFVIDFQINFGVVTPKLDYFYIHFTAVDIKVVRSHVPLT